MVAENYLNCFSNMNTSSAETLERIATANEFLSVGDLLSSKIFYQHQWQLLDDSGLISVVCPTNIVKGSYTLSKFPEFMNSILTHKKYVRLLKELNSSINHRLYVSRKTFLTEVVSLIFDFVVSNLEAARKASKKKS